MTSRGVGTALRLLGPALQIVCLIVLFTAPGAGLGGRRLFLYVGFGAGLVMVLVGNILTQAQPRPASGRSFDLRLDDSTPVEPNPKTREPG